jgi:hypothetical protein
MSGGNAGGWAAPGWALGGSPAAAIGRSSESESSAKDAHTAPPRGRITADVSDAFG